MDIHNELKKVSLEISKIIANDDFPSEIEPEELRKAVLSYPLRGGKRIRPALLLWVCGLCGGDLNKALYAACSAEIYHNWTLVHDDIVDEDDTRRGEPTTHKEIEAFARNTLKLSEKDSAKYGVDLAILAGDLQQSWALKMLLRSSLLGLSANIVLSLCEDMTNILSSRLISGEALDISYSYKDIENIMCSDIENMLFLKTGALLNFCVISGAKIAANSSELTQEKREKLSQFAYKFGLSFQLRDDYLGIFGSYEKFGKPIGSDLSSSKPTLMILETIKRCNNDDKKSLFSLFGKKKISSAELKSVKEIISKYGVEDLILKKCEKLNEDMNATLMTFPLNEYRDMLLELNNNLTIRTS